MAIEYQEEALNVRRKLYGFHPTLGQGYNNLCLVYDRMHDYKKAKDYARKGLTVKKMLVTKTSNTVLVSLLNMAHMTFRYDGNSGRGFSLLDEAYEIRRELGLNHSLSAFIHMYRGDMQLDLERYERAAESFAIAVQIFEREKGLRPRELSESFRKWGVALKNQGKFEEAERCLNRSLKIIQKVDKESGDSCHGSLDVEGLKETLRELRDVKGMNASGR